MERVRISPDLVLFFDPSGRPAYTEAQVTPDVVELRVKHWLSTPDGGADKYSFVERWYENFDAKAVATIDSQGTAVSRVSNEPTPQQFGLSSTEMRRLHLMRFVAVVSLILGIISATFASWGTPFFVAAAISLAAGIGYLLRFHFSTRTGGAYRRYRRTLHDYASQRSAEARPLRPAPTETTDSDYVVIFRKRFWHWGTKTYLNAEDYGHKAFPLKIRKRKLK